MDKICIRGGKPLHGTIAIGGAKNAGLPLMTASLLTEETLTLSNLPHLADITTMANLLTQLGVVVSDDGLKSYEGRQVRTVSLTARKIASTVAEYDLVRK